MNSYLFKFDSFNIRDYLSMSRVKFWFISFSLHVIKELG